MDDETPIGDLDLSVRTSELLAKWKVETVEALLARPEIRAPKAVIAELSALFEENDLGYAGKLVADVPQLLTASGDVRERWATIRKWLEQNSLETLESFAPPASQNAIEVAETALDQTLPADYKAFLAIHNGQSDIGPMIGTCSLFPVGKLAEAYEWVETLNDEQDEGEVDAEECGPGIRPVSFSPGWIPIGRSARGRDYLCIDLDPAPGGVSGQIIQMSVDFSDRPLIAKSFTEMLSVFFEQMQTGEIVTDDDDDGDLEEDEDEES